MKPLTKGFTLMRRLFSHEKVRKVNGKPFPTGILGIMFYKTKEEAHTEYERALTLDKGRYIGEVK
jgi:hypothetical protein